MSEAIERKLVETTEGDKPVPTAFLGSVGLRTLVELKSLDLLKADDGSIGIPIDQLRTISDTLEGSVIWLSESGSVPDIGLEEDDPVLPKAHSLAGGRVKVDYGSMELIVDGESKHLERKAFNLLCYFIEHKGEVVSRDEILQACWGSKNYDLRNVTTQIHRIRQTLGEDLRWILQTKHSRGILLDDRVKAPGSNNVRVNGHSISEPEV